MQKRRSDRAGCHSTFYFVVNGIESDQVTEVGYFRFCSLQSYNSGNSQADVVTKIISHSSTKR